MKSILSFLALLLLAGGSFASDFDTFGAELDESIPEASLASIASAGDDYLGKSVRVSARVSQVCQKKGCFFIAQQGDAVMRISFIDYSFFVPTDISGKHVIFVGEVVARDVSEGEAMHYAEDFGGESEPMKPGKTWEIVATSVRVPRG